MEMRPLINDTMFFGCQLSTNSYWGKMFPCNTVSAAAYPITNRRLNLPGNTSSFGL